MEPRNLILLAPGLPWCYLSLSFKSQGYCIRVKNGLAHRLRRCLPLLIAVATGAGALPARAVTLPARPVTEAHLVKAQHEGLRFHWQATVSEDGGVFVLRRHGPRPGADLVRSASPRQRDYDAQWHAPATSGVYELRYRSARGVESVLATLLVNCQSLEGGCPVQDAPQWRPPVASPSFALASPMSVSWRQREPEPRLETTSHEPLLPPPRRSSRA